MVITEAIIQELKKKPLAMEILLLLINKSETSVNNIALILGRSPPTISASLSELLIMDLVDKREDGRQRFYSIKNEAAKMILNNESLMAEYKNQSSRLRIPSFYNQQYFEEKLSRYLESDFNVVKEYRVNTYTRQMSLDYIIKKNNNNIGIYIKRITKGDMMSNDMLLGRLIDLSKGENELTKLIVVILATPRISGGFNRDLNIDLWKYSQLIDSFSTPKLKIVSIIESIERETMLDESFIKYISDKLKNSIE